MEVRTGSTKKKKVMVEKGLTESTAERNGSRDERMRSEHTHKKLSGLV